MRPKLLLLTLCLYAFGVMLGQNGPALVGMPEVGVTLTGTAEHPEVVSNSGRGILGYVILSRDANGRGSFMPTLKTSDMRWALVGPTSGPPVWSYADTSTIQFRQWRPHSSGYSRLGYLRQWRICRCRPGQSGLLRHPIGSSRW
jgi:hypothetical protein